MRRSMRRSNSEHTRLHIMTMRLSYLSILGDSVCIGIAEQRQSGSHMEKGDWLKSMVDCVMGIFHLVLPERNLSTTK